MIEAKKKPSVEQMDCFRGLLSSMTHRDFEKIRPSIEKMLKKSPDNVLQAVSHLVSSVKLDMGR